MDAAYLSVSKAGRLHPMVGVPAYTATSRGGRPRVSLPFPTLGMVCLDHFSHVCVSIESHDSFTSQVCCVGLSSFAHLLWNFQQSILIA